MALDAALLKILPEDVVVPQRLPPDERLFRHAKRPSWGVGLWVAEGRSRRRLRFQDGELRAFKRGHYDKLVPVDPAKVDVDDVFEELKGDEVEARAEKLARAKKASPPVMTFDQQVRVFRDLFPGGFEGEAWIEAHRTPSSGNGAKRHLDPTLALAKERLSAKVVKDADPLEVFDALLAVLDTTSLVARRRVLPLGMLGDDDKRALGTALADVLHGKARFRVRMERWLVALSNAVGRDMSWPLATAPLGLVHPERHVVVKRSVFLLQGRAVAPDSVVKKRPSRRAYRHAKRIAIRTRDALAEAGESPRDLLDVRAFIWETLRPAGRRRLDEIRGA